MPDYKEMYYILFNEVSKTIENLKEIQQKTEEIYTNISQAEEKTAGKKE